MKTLVMKFGGTSVATEEVRQKAVEHVEDAVLQGYRVVVVVSAMGRRGEPYATDELLSIVDNRPASDRDMDILLSCGEAISSVVFAAHLREHGLEATVLSGGQAGIVTDGAHGNARIQMVKTHRIEDELKSHRVVVVMGFQGCTDEGDITTLGRGGSDTTATALGTALDAQRVEIFSDVDGIFTADPRVVPNATLLPRLMYTEACTLAWEGAKVIHPRAVQVAMQTNTSVSVRNTKKNTPGTQIGSTWGMMEDQQRHEGCVIGITHQTNRIQVTVDALGSRQQTIFTEMARLRIQPEFSMSSPSQISFTIPRKDAEKVERSLAECGQESRMVSSCARVSVVGTRLDEIPGLMGRVLETLAAEHIPVLQSADSQSVIRVLVHEPDMERAVQALHRTLVEEDGVAANGPLLALSSMTGSS